MRDRLVAVAGGDSFSYGYHVNLSSGRLLALELKSPEDRQKKNEEPAQ